VVVGSVTDVLLTEIIEGVHEVLTFYDSVAYSEVTNIMTEL